MQGLNHLYDGFDCLPIAMGVYQNMISYLSDLETYQIAWAAADRCKFKSNQGLINYKRVDQRRDNFATAREGLTGEWAVANELGLSVNTENYLGGDPGWDFEYYGWKVDVKTTRAKLLLFQSMSKFVADVAVLVKVLDDDTVRICGAISRDRFAQVHEIRNLGYQDNCIATIDQLTPLKEFKEYARRNPKA